MRMDGIGICIGIGIGIGTMVALVQQFPAPMSLISAE